MATAGIKYVLREWLIGKQLLIQVDRLRILIAILREGGEDINNFVKTFEREEK